MSKAVSQESSLNKNVGVIVLELAPNGPAENSGLRPNDIILQVGEHIIEEPSHMAATVKAIPSGTQVSFVIIRDKQKLTTPVLIGGRGWAAALNDGNMELAMGLSYLKGDGVSTDYKEAAQWFRKSAERGNKDGQIYLGNMHKGGWGVPKDHAEAMKWYQKAAEQGDIEVINTIGIMHAKGEGVPKSDKEALVWYKKSAELGNPVAMANVGVKYLGYGDIPQNDEEAYFWLSQAIKYGGKNIRDAARLRLTEVRRLFWSEEKLNDANARIESWKPKSAQQNN